MQDECHGLISIMKYRRDRTPLDRHSFLTRDLRKRSSREVSTKERLLEVPHPQSSGFIGPPTFGDRFDNVHPTF